MSEMQEIIEKAEYQKKICEGSPRGQVVLRDLETIYELIIRLAKEIGDRP